VSFADVGLVFFVGAGALLAASVLLARIRVEGRIPFAAADETSARRMIQDGFAAILRTRHAPLVLTLVSAQAFVRGCLNVLIVVAAFRVLHGSASDVGYLTAAVGVGGLLGAFGAMTLEGRRLAVPFGLALVFWGLPIALIAPRPYFGLALFMLAIVGAANSVEDVALFTLLQRMVPDELLTRLLGVVWGVSMGAVAIGSIVAPAIVELLGPRPAFAVVGAILPLLTLLTYRRLVEIDRTAAAPPPELELIERVPIFAPLSVAAKEHIAASLVPVSVPAGELVIRAGDAGDRFYIVGDGELQIDAVGRRSTAHRADYFGEIALLQDVPRTASVKASVDSELYALQRDDFLAAVTGHAVAHAAGQQVAEERLAGATQ
jgi:Cyclic nucleotide-binding domain/Major Facilitator Superfamily